MIIEKIKNLVEVISGFSFRRAISVKSEGNSYVVQARDIKGDVYLSLDSLSKISLDGINTKAVIKEGDVLMAERGNFSAGVAEKDLAGSVASSSVFILRPITEKITSEYLAVYFNSIHGRTNVTKAAKGALIKNISRKEFLELDVPIPTMEKQELIVDAYKNKLKQEELLETKKELVGQVIESAIKQILTGKII